MQVTLTCEVAVVLLRIQASSEQQSFKSASTQTSKNLLYPSFEAHGIPLQRQRGKEILVELMCTRIKEHSIPQSIHLVEILLLAVGQSLIHSDGVAISNLIRVPSNICEIRLNPSSEAHWNTLIFVDS